jgi:hypothetical protein
MDKITFRKTEKKLYNYFGKDKKIYSINKKMNLLKGQIGDIENKLKNVDIDIPEESRSMTYEERIQTSSDGASYAERAMIRITDKLLIEKARKEEEVAELEEELRNIEADSVIIECNIKDIKNEDMEFLKMKYKEDLKDWQIGYKLGIDQSTATRTRQRLVENIARWEEWCKRLH